jgi:hypothetical protein
MTGLAQWLFPPRRRRLPAGRALNIAARTVHIATMGVLVGGHVFDVTEAALWPWLVATLASGAVLLLLEVYPSAHWLHHNCALAVYAKLVLLALVPWAWDQRVAILLVVVALASALAHAPKRVRHYSVLQRRVMFE